MIEGEPIYARCPNFKKGAGKCCGARHDAQRRRYEEFTVELEYMDGRPSKQVPAFTLREPGLEYSEWQTIKLESEEVQGAVHDWPYLTRKTEDALRNIHPGVFVTSLDKNCSFRR